MTTAYVPKFEGLKIEAAKGVGGYNADSFAKMKRMWKESVEGTEIKLKHLEKYLTKYIQGRLKRNNVQYGYLKKTGANFFKTSIEKGEANIQVRMTYNFPKSKYGTPKLQYAFPLGIPGNLTRNTDAIKKWLKQKSTRGMSVYYLSKTKDGYTKKPATKEWHYKSAARSITFQGQQLRRSNKKYRPKPFWYRINLDNPEVKRGLQTEIDKFKDFAVNSFKKKIN